MSVLPEGEQLRRAVKWISDARVERPEASLAGLVGEACLKFDLAPKEADFLMKLLAQQKAEKE